MRARQECRAFLFFMDLKAYFSEVVRIDMRKFGYLQTS